MSTIEKIKSSKAAKLARQGWLVYLGTAGVAYDRFQSSLKTLGERREELAKELADRGTEFETAAQEAFTSNRAKVEEFAKPRLDKVNGIIGRARSTGADRVGELSDEVSKLGRKIDTLSKKVAPAAATKTAAQKAA